MLQLQMLTFSSQKSVMKKQTYENYIRFYAPHHFVFYPIAALLLGASIYFSFTQPETLIWIFISICFAFFIALSLMLRQHYALTLQNRIVRLEVRYRFFSLTGKRLDETYPGLRDSQVFALRFAPDEEFVALAQRVFNENLSGEKTKKAITNWKGDYERV